MNSYMTNIDKNHSIIGKFRTVLKKSLEKLVEKYNFLHYDINAAIGNRRKIT